MADASIVSNIINAGVGGLVIIVVIVFLRFLSAEREKSNAQHDSMMKFIAEQRADNNSANVKAAELIAIAQAKSTEISTTTYVQVANALRALTVVISQLKDSHIAHDTLMKVSLSDMKKAKATAKKRES